MGLVGADEAVIPRVDMPITLVNEVAYPHTGELPLPALPDLKARRSRLTRRGRVVVTLSAVIVVLGVVVGVRPATKPDNPTTPVLSHTEAVVAQRPAASPPTIFLPLQRPSH